MKAVCKLCPHRCALEEGQLGMCQARYAKAGKVVSQNYGRITALNLDPIEKKPLAMFFPGSMILSVGSYGCNLRCPFCQNSEISQAGFDDIRTEECLPKDLVQSALNLRSRGNIGVAFTYNEPLVGYEYVLDASRMLKDAGLKTVIVTNGMINRDPMEKLLPYVDAMNIDLKGFTQKFYDKCCGDLEAVKSTIALCQESCHVEVTFLVVPGMNDSLEEMDDLSNWLGSLNPDIVLHITRFFPSYRMQDAEPTDVELMKQMKTIAQTHLKHVFLGNVWQEIVEEYPTAHYNQSGGMR
ncbi:MAG: AmmeMemoRadiSam system radical SAM enzyme [Sphaerochaetaceae bacterium]|jgi:pyruvate formate lyase activating enzyme|nr:AmmeMemoRadiSam system radical SAM enzyme [Sphaerochaetaceae bacterium]